jgi:glycosyltransferase involved in cell wall biosynthesis
MQIDLEFRGEPIATRPAPLLDIVIPVHNEAGTLRASVLRLHKYLSTQFPLTWVITIADNASGDDTWRIAQELAKQLPDVRVLHLEEKGRGRALRAAWSTSNATVLTYMDVDLSTDLNALLPLVAPLVSAHSDVAIGTRIARAACVRRGAKRELISRAYNALLHVTLRNEFSDAQCGFKAVRADVARVVMPLVEDDGWFFDTELLVLAERSGMRIHEVPVDWTDDPDSRVDVVRTARDDLKGIWRLMRRPSGAALSQSRLADNQLAGQAARFVSIGIVSTLLFAMLLVLLSPALGIVAADIIALLVCSIANTSANRRLTFAARGRVDRRRHYGIGIALGFLPIVLTLTMLVLLHAADVSSTVVTICALTVTSGATAVLRFVLLRRWLFGPRT